MNLAVPSSHAGRRRPVVRRQCRGMRCTRVCVRLAALLVAGLGAAPRLSDARGAEPLSAAGAADEVRASSTLIPPVPISTRSRAEWRVALHNDSSETGAFDVVVALRPAAGGPEETLNSQRVQLPAQGRETLQGWIDAAGRPGRFTIRCQVAGPAGLQFERTHELTVVDCEQRAVPWCPVAWIEPGAIAAGRGYPRQRADEEEEFRARLDQWRQLGVQCLVIAYAESIYRGGGAHYPSAIYGRDPADPPFDVVGTILDQAARNGQHVIVGLGRGSDLTLTWDAWDDPERLARGVAESLATAAELWRLYGRSPAFYGWYLAHEANDLPRASAHYYNPVARKLREYSADKPVLIAPSGTPIVSAEILAECEADIVAYQDAVGPGYVPYQYTYDPERRIAQLDATYAAYATAHGGARQHLWSTLELWQMDGPEYRDAFPATMDRVRRQIDVESRHVDVLTAYAALGFLEPPDSPAALGGARAQQLFRDYRAYYRSATSRFGLSSTAEETKP